MNNTLMLPCLRHGVGVGLKPQHVETILTSQPELGFVEIHAENYLVDGGRLHHDLQRVIEHYQLSIHGLGLSIGAESGIDSMHLQRVANLVARYQPAVFSEHLAWATHEGYFLNDLLPIAYTEATLARVCRHIDQVQNALQRQILIENPSTYVQFIDSTYSETEFIGEIIKRSGCGLLLDVNNVYVSCQNHGLDHEQYCRDLPLSAVREIHLAGFHLEQDSVGDPLLIDHHGSLVDKAVWALYDQVIAQIGAVPTLIEWDNDVPTFDVLYSEVRYAASICANRAVA